ncbi:MAG: PAS domain S-box protein [Planctomycetes bacterium]|nr:PAS domain S-box protein [Planctomycetota bacterium]
MTDELPRHYLDAIWAHATVALFILDERQHCVFLNPAAVALTGFSLEEIRGRPLLDRVRLPRSSDTLSAFAEGPIDRASPHDHEPGDEVFVHKDGHHYDVTVTTSPICKDGLTMGTVLEVQDNTERKRVHAARDASERTYRTLFQHVTEELHYWRIERDPKGRIITWRLIDANPAALTTWKRELADIRGKSTDEIFGAGSTEHSRGIVELVMGERRQRTYEDFLPALARHFHFTTIPIADDTFITTGSDVTSAMAAQHTAESQRAQLEAVFASMDDGVMVFDAAGTALLVNESMARLCGYVDAAQMRREWAHFVEVFEVYRLDGSALQPEDWPVMRMLRGERLRGFEAKVRRRDIEKDLVLSFSGQPVVVPGRSEPLAVMVARDITERKTNEQQLLESEARFRALADNIAQLAWMANADGWIFWYNRRWFEYTGATLEQMQGWGWQAVHHPEHVERVTETFQRHLASGEPFDETFPLRGADGAFRWFLTRAFPIRDDHGQVTRWFGTNTDVTQQREDQEALRRSEERFRATFEQAAVGIAYVATGGRWLWVNHRLCDIVGYSREELLERTFRDITHPDDLELDLKQARQVLEGSITTYSLEKRYLRKDRSMVWVNLTMSLLRRPDGTPDYFIAVMEDIRERKAFELALRESEARYRTVTEMGPQIIWTATGEGSVDYFNSRWYRFTGRTPESSLGDHWIDAVHPEEASDIRKGWQVSLHSGEDPNLEFRLRGEAGSYRWFQVNALSVRDDAGRIVRWFGSLSDIDEQKRANDALVAANRDLEQFAYVSSHDLQEPLRMITNYLDLLEVKHGDRLEAPARGFLRAATEAAVRMRALINDLLVYTRIGRADPAWREFGVRDALADALMNLDAAVTTSGAELTIGELPLAVGSQSELTLVLQHLIGNAITFQAPGRTPRISLSAATFDGACQFTIGDNGIGIEPRNQARIFEVFQRLHNRTEYPGSGIGLAICKRIVERHRGRITVSSRPGEGSVFRFTWPCASHPSPP